MLLDEAGRLRVGSCLSLPEAYLAQIDGLKPGLFWSMYDESLYAERALRAGAMGYINKENVTDTIVEAIRTVLDDKVFLSPNMSSQVLQRLVSGKNRLEQSPAG